MTFARAAQGKVYAYVRSDENDPEKTSQELDVPCRKGGLPYLDLAPHSPGHVGKLRVADRNAARRLVSRAALRERSCHMQQTTASDPGWHLVLFWRFTYLQVAHIFL